MKIGFTLQKLDEMLKMYLDNIKYKIYSRIVLTCLNLFTENSHSGRAKSILSDSMNSSMSYICWYMLVK